MQETKVTAAEAMEDDDEQEGYVEVGTRFHRVTMRPGGAMARRRLHYLESCYLCKKSIACDRDVFMYKGDAAFCSEDCRDEQMDMDEALHAAARRHRLRLLQLRSPASSSSSSSSQAAPEAAASTRPPPPPVMRRRPTIANLAARKPAARGRQLATYTTTPSHAARRAMVPVHAVAPVIRIQAVRVRARRRGISR